MSKHGPTTKAEAERLHYLIEECAEVQKCATKVLRHGWESYNPTEFHGPDNRADLLNEIGDVLTAIREMALQKDIDEPVPKEFPLEWMHHQ